MYKICLPISRQNIRAYNDSLDRCKREQWKHKKNKIVFTLKATGDLLVFLILTALLTCLPGSSSKEMKNNKDK